MINSFFANSYHAMPLFGGVGFGLLSIGFILLFVLIIATVVLKGYALWHAAKRDEVPWFVVLLVLNTMGILELVYLFFIVKKWNTSKEVEKASSTPSNTNTTPSAQ